MTLSNTQARDMASLLHPFTNLTLLRQTGPMVIERGAGVFVVLVAFDDVTRRARSAKLPTGFPNG